MTADFSELRVKMVDGQLRTTDVTSLPLLTAMLTVPREEFVPEKHRALAFSDLEIPIEPGANAGERMWQPKMEARVLQELALKKADRVLEVGTGSGYLTALMAHRAAISQRAFTG
jgi:protein-L-isoaspartate(D-aspartate) O-methyltransferase